MKFMVAQHLDALLQVSTIYHLHNDGCEIVFYSTLILLYLMLSKMSIYHSNIKVKIATLSYVLEKSKTVHFKDGMSILIYILPGYKTLTKVMMKYLLY